MWLLVNRPDWETGMIAARIALLAGPVTWPMYLTAVGPFIPRLFLPVALLWFLPRFGVDQQLALMLSLAVLLVRRRSIPAIPEHQTRIVIDLTDRDHDALPIGVAAVYDPLRRETRNTRRLRSV